jgi:DNA adenine methylase
MKCKKEFKAKRGLDAHNLRKRPCKAIEATVAATAPAAVVDKPFLKWVGGKTQILDAVLEKFPRTITNYYEPFVGGGSVLLGFLTKVTKGEIKLAGKVYASDLNANLIGLYKNIQNNIEELILELTSLNNEFNVLKGTVVNRAPRDIIEAKSSQESYFYWIRTQFNTLSKLEKASVVGSARLLFLNKTCFRGVYREGPHGFNVPFGHYKNPAIFDATHLRATSRLIKDVIFESHDFSTALTHCGTDDFVYLDPPYAPENATSFVGYTADGFSGEKHKELFKLCNTLQEKGVKLLMSNADVKLVKDAFKDDTWTTNIIECRRAIHSKKPESKTNEVLIFN